MRAELLKRLDGLLKDDGASRDGMGPLEWQGLRKEWLEIRAEIAAERCENCAHWQSRWAPHEQGACYEAFGERVTPSDFCCSLFGKKGTQT